MSLFRYPSHPSCSPSKLLTSTKDWQYLLEDLVKKDDSIPTVATGDGQYQLGRADRADDGVSWCCRDRQNAVRV